MTPLGDFDLRMANRHFGGWIDAAGDGQDFAVPMAFPIEGWETSACVVMRQANDGTVTGDVYGADGHAEAAWKQALAVLSLDVDGTGFKAVGKRDPVIGELQRKYPGLRPVLFHSPYEAAAAFVIGHRMSIAEGRTIRKRLAAECGDAIETPLGLQYAFPRPQRLLQIQAFPGIPAAKWPRLQGVAQAAIEGVLDRKHLLKLAGDIALRRLRAINGLGPFFSQGVLIRGGGTLDELSEDLVTKQAVQHAYGLQTSLDHAAILGIARTWRPFRTWCMVMLHIDFRRHRMGQE
jgi:DNA-3-methyladenine glycosylase II